MRPVPQPRRPKTYPSFAYFFVHYAGTFIIDMAFGRANNRCTILPEVSSAGISPSFAAIDQDVVFPLSSARVSSFV